MTTVRLQSKLVFEATAIFKAVQANYEPPTSVADRITDGTRKTSAFPIPAFRIVYGYTQHSCQCDTFLFQHLMMQLCVLLCTDLNSQYGSK